MIRHLDLFSGIGGFSLAAQWTGKVEAAGFCEIDPTCRRVLAKHWPGVPQHDDIKTLTADVVREWGRRNADFMAVANSDIPDGKAHSSDGMGEREQAGTSSRIGIDLITGGYPCQPFSLAGQRRGTEDDRHLWPEMRRVINELRPRYVLAENVVGHISMGLDTVLAELESDGYACGAIVIPACAVNALHRRDRVWIMAYAAGSRSTRTQDEIRTRRDSVDVSGSIPDMGHTNDQGLERRIVSGECARERTTRTASGEPTERTGDETTRALDAGTDGISSGLDGRLASRSAWRDGSWEVNLPRVVTEEINRKAKLMAAGNAIVPQVAYEILSVMLGDES